ncbi:MAG: nuclear transport factor 2 family protein [Acidobacteriota bacterium]|nr:nuclear transport factor 2 family protein [Acidobacteriota bacterium]
MTIRSILHSLLLSACMVILPLNQSSAQSSVAPTGANEKLFYAISAQDTALFNAVNHCDMPKVEIMFAEDVEFYHDRDDPQYGRKTVSDSIKNNLCGKVNRELVAGTLEVYSIHGYGAVEIGVHRFHHIGSQDRDVIGEARFIHLWRLKNGAWQITRVISYDHGVAK